MGEEDQARSHPLHECPRLAQHQAPRTGGFKHHMCIDSRPGGWKSESRHEQGCDPSEGSGEHPSVPLHDSRRLRTASLPSRCRVVLSLYFYIQISLFLSFFLKDIIIRLGLTLIQYDLIVTRSRSQVRVDTHLGGGANQQRCLSQWRDITWRHYLTVLSSNPKSTSD